MKAHEYQMILDQVTLLARLALNVEDVDEALSAIDHADSVGPLLDPTAWMKGHEEMGEVKKLLEAFAKFQVEAARQKARVEARGRAAEERALEALGGAG